MKKKTGEGDTAAQIDCANINVEEQKKTVIYLVKHKAAATSEGRQTH